MSYPPSHKLLTAEEFGELPDLGQPYELVRGVVVVREHPMPVHGVLAAQIGALLINFVRPRKLGRVTVESGYVTERGPDSVRGPDVAFVRMDRVPTRADLDRYVEGAPDLAVEIRSPGDRAGEIAEKVAEYFRGGAKLVWGVEPHRRVVLVHTPDGHTRLLRDGDTIDGGDVLPGFTAPVGELLPDF